MTGWDITPSGVQGVLNKVVKAAQGLGDASTKLESGLTSAAAAAGTIAAGDYEDGHAVLKPGQYGPPSPGAEGLVAAALGQFIQSNEQRLAYIATRTGNSIKGAQDATNEYVKGDIAMAAHAQAEALKEPVIDLPGAKGGSGGGGG
ncbi:DUF6507 family protein, partial [Streptomyces tremellae]|uniref:DUF6507 family protein n=1 Tax=Streptomyces tremellae TaxID=1124239 RepID=UPI0031EF3665